MLERVIKENEELKNKLQIAIETLEYISKSTPIPENKIELENALVAKQALEKIKHDSTSNTDENNMGNKL